MRVEVREINSFKWLGFVDLPELEGWGARVVHVAPPMGFPDKPDEPSKSIVMETTWLRFGTKKIPICLCDRDDWNWLEREKKRSIMG